MFATTLTQTLTVTTSAVRLDTDAFDYDPTIPFKAKNTGTVPLFVGGVGVTTATGQAVQPGETYSNLLEAGSAAVYGITASTTTVVTTQTADFSGALTSENVAADDGFAAWTGDYRGLAAGSTIVAGTSYLTRLHLRRPQTLTKAAVIYTTAAGTPSGTYLALFDTAGNELAVTADASTAFSTTLGLKSANFAVPYAAAAGDYFGLYLINSGVTVPVLGAHGTTGALIANASKTGFNARFATGPTGNTTTAPAATFTTPTADASARWFAIG